MWPKLLWRRNNVVARIWKPGCDRNCCDNKIAFFTTDGWTDGWTDGQMDGLTDGRMDGWTDRWTDGRTDGWMDGWMDGRTNKSRDSRPEKFCDSFFLLCLGKFWKKDQNRVEKICHGTFPVSSLEICQWLSDNQLFSTVSFASVFYFILNRFFLRHPIVVACNLRI